MLCRHAAILHDDSKTPLVSERTRRSGGHSRARQRRHRRRASSCHGSRWSCHTAMFHRSCSSCMRKEHTMSKSRAPHTRVCKARGSLLRLEGGGRACSGACAWAPADTAGNDAGDHHPIAWVELLHVRADFSDDAHELPRNKPAG